MTVPQATGSASRLALFGAVVTMASNFGVAWFVSRDGAATAGVFFVATAIITILGNGSALGTMTGLVYFLSDEDGVANPRSVIRTAIVPVLAFSAVIAIALAAAAGPIADLVGQGRSGDIATMVRALAVTVIPWAITTSLLGATRGLGSMRPTVAVGQIIRPGLQLAGLAIVFSADGTPSPSTVAIAWGGPVFIGAVAAVGAVFRQDGFAAAGPTSVTRQAFWSYTRPRAASTALQVALERIDVVLVGAVVGTAPAGIYGALTRYITAGNFLMFSVAQAVSPALRRAVAAADWGRAQLVLQKATAWLVLVAWPYFLLVGLKSEPLARLLSPEYVADSRILGLLVVGMLFSAMSGPIDLTLLMLGRSGLALAGASVAIVTDIVLVLVLASRYGLAGAAIAWSVSVIVQNAMASYFVGRESVRQAGDPATRLTAPSHRSATAAAGALLAVVPVALATPSTFGGLLVSGIVAGVLLGLWAFGFSDRLAITELVPLPGRPRSRDIGGQPEDRRDTNDPKASAAAELES